LRETLGLAVLGAGRIGCLHAENLRGRVRGARLVAVADPDPGRARAAAAGARAVAEVHQALADPEVEAVVIASPTDLHPGHIEAAARAGKAIFCEKPVSLDLAAAAAALAAVQRAGVPFQIGFQRRHDPGYAAARAHLEEGRLGRLEAFRSLTCDPAPPPLEYLRVSGGIFLDMAIHDLDLARFFGGDIAEVTALGQALVEPAIASLGDVDTAVVALRFASGAVGSIQCWRRAVYGYDVRTELFGSAGKVVVEEDFATPLRRYGPDGVATDYPASFLARFRQAYRLELQAFVDAVRQGRPPTPGPQDAWAALLAGVAATRSLREGRPVRLEEVAW
jgi:myo-inositol 2-dehydrogenase/D-chiro-inositol 1-dehydrogenase